MLTPWQGQGADCNNHSIPSPSERQQPSQNRHFIPVPESQKDQVHCFERQQLTTVFHWIGRCCLLQHMCQLGLEHAEDCPCQTGPQNCCRGTYGATEDCPCQTGPQNCCRGTYGATEDCPCQTGPQNCCRGTYGATEDCPCETGPQSPEHVLQFCPLSKEVGVSVGPREQCCKGTHMGQLKTAHARQDLRAQNMFYSSAHSLKKQDCSSGPREQCCKGTYEAAWRTC